MEFELQRGHLLFAIGYRLAREGRKTFGEAVLDYGSQPPAPPRSGAA